MPYGFGYGGLYCSVYRTVSTEMPMQGQGKETPVSDGFTPEDVARRLGQIEHLLNEVLERQERNSGKDRLGLERAIEKVGLELSDHRNISEGANFYCSERVTEMELENRLFERDRQGWEMVGLSPISTPDDSGENLFLAVFRQSAHYEPQALAGAVESSK
jgi:hypothetical protein